MFAFLNNRFVPFSEAKIPANDRGFLYGDGLFETIRIHGERPFLWEWHMKRLTSGTDFLRIPLLQSNESLLSQVNELTDRNNSPESIARITISRGASERGYGVSGNEQPTLLITQHPLPAPSNKPISVVTTKALVTAGDPLTKIKTANKLTSILAKQEATEKRADDGLILNNHGHVVETSSANLFWVKEGTLRTPPIEDGVLPGITRQLVIRKARALGQAVREESTTSDCLCQAEAVFVTSVAYGIRTIAQKDGITMRKHPLVSQLQDAYDAELAQHAADHD